MSESNARSKALLTFTLHAHLPYVVNHGTWPHGMEWLHEAVAETYLPLLRVFARLERDGLALRCNLNLSPILLEQLTHPVFMAEFPRYLARKSVAAREDEAFFTQSGEAEYAETARFWQRFYAEAAEDFEALGGDVVRAFKGFADRGLIEIITCAATHGYMPLLGTDESVRAQIRVAVDTHTRHFGRAPRGIWLPECGYRPAGMWTFPTRAADGAPLPGPVDRIGIEQALSESGLDFTFVDTHLVEASRRAVSPYGSPYGETAAIPMRTEIEQPERSLYFPYFIDGPSAHDGHHAPVTIFPRDPRTGLQVWSGDTGYPGDGNYVDFHKKRWPGGHRYWKVTGPHVSQEDKQPYRPAEAAARVQAHAQHFTGLVRTALAEAGGEPGATPVLCSPFDAELFGHWWFEGPLWLEAVARALHAEAGEVDLISCPEYLEQFPRAGSIAMPEGSWGADGNNQVWLNPETAWTYSHLYPAELYVREVCSGDRWQGSQVAKEMVQQMCRELLLLESSDWQFLITTGAARDYAEMRFMTHHDQFQELKRMWQAFEADGGLDEHSAGRLAALRERDGVFPEINPAYWASGAVADNGL